MAELPHPYVCDVCHVHKGEANHWWRVWRNGPDIVISPWWRELVRDSHRHACGEEHALRIAAQLLGEKRDVAPEVQA